MDMITLAMAKGYADSQRLGYSEQTVLTFDGNLTGKTFVTPYVKLSNTPRDLNGVARMVMSFSPEFAEMMGSDKAEATAEAWTVESAEGVQKIVMNDGIVALSLTDPQDGLSVGVWVLAQSQLGDGLDNWISLVEFAETIHPIDPKYLPGVCLPVVELETIPTVEGVVLSENDAEKLKALDSAPFILIVYPSAGTRLPIYFVCRGYFFKYEGICDAVVADSFPLYPDVTLYVRLDITPDECTISSNVAELL